MQNTRFNVFFLLFYKYNLENKIDELKNEIQEIKKS